MESEEKKERFDPGAVVITVHLSPDGTSLITDYRFPDGSTKTKPTSFGPDTCEEGVELLDNMRKQARSDQQNGGPGNAFTGTQQEWQNHVNRLLASRGQKVDFKK